MKTKKSKPTKPTESVLQIRLPSDLHELFLAVCKSNDMSAAQVLRGAARDYIEEKCFNEAVFDPVACSMAELETAINIARNEERKSFLEGVRHVRIFMRSATNGEVS